MATTPATFKALFPEFTTTGDARIQVFLDQAARCVNSRAWGGRTDDGIHFLAAHLLSTFGGEAGATSAASVSQITQKKVGDISASFAQSQNTDDDSFLSSTRYGQFYLTLRKKVFAARCLC